MNPIARQPGRMATVCLVSLLLVAPRGAWAQDKPPAPADPTPYRAIESARVTDTISTQGVRRVRALDSISADSLKGHLSFLASDLLEGRDTPSRGLDLAAEYIAAQFRRAGLEPVGDDGYFQTGQVEVIDPDTAGFRFEVTSNGLSTPIDIGENNPFYVRATTLDIPPTAVYKVGANGLGLDVAAVAGKVVFFELPNMRALGPMSPEAEAARGMVTKLVQSQAALLVLFNRNPQPGQMPGAPSRQPRVFDPERMPPMPGAGAGKTPVSVTDPKVIAIFDTLPIGLSPATASIHLGATTRRPARVRNVVGLLRGSDPALNDTCVMVTAHYDHIGVKGPDGTDRIFNGANDDGSGTVSVIELASALATLKDQRPRRSVLFAAFYGEEKGLLGSRYYGRHPIFPVAKTIADLNLEQVGRTDDSEGPRLATASLTGFGYSDVSAVLAAAGEAEGIQVVKHPRNSDAFFARSDNQALADLGVPAHTLCVAFNFPDYHGAADHWDKVDYPNMARINRAVCRALLAIADDPAEPHWNPTEPRAARYLKAWTDRRGK